MLGVFFNSTPEDVNKSLWFAQTLTKEGFEFFPSDKNVVFILYFTLVLLPAEQGNVI